MSFILDANVLIALLNPQDFFHTAAVEKCLAATDLSVLNITKAEALVLPAKSRKYDIADEMLANIGIVTKNLEGAVARKACHLRALHGNKNFPMVDAVVVAYGIVHDRTIITGDRKWPDIAEATVEYL